MSVFLDLTLIYRHRFSSASEASGLSFVCEWSGVTLISGSSSPHFPSAGNAGVRYTQTLD